ncbi:MAG: PilZ domain-containing protein [Candidatus Omnitrophica bacterium]|nr:PilZ domain-containing protein [Candidatus Omnitrophota bacterium]
MAANKRRYSRLDSVINGTFLSREDNAVGDMMLTNFSRDGFKAALSRPIVPGRIIQFQMRYPNQTMPIFATGKVMWVKSKNQDLTYGFDAGIHLIEPDAIIRQKASEYDFDNWHIKQVADFAKQRGYLAKHFPDQVFKLSCFVPSALLIYFILGAIVSFLNVNMALIYSASIMAYFLSIFVTTAIWLLTEKSHKTLIEKISVIFPVSAARISAHISYGVFFLRGLFSKKEYN